MSRVLLTQGELKQTLGIVRGLGKQKHEVEVLSMGRHSIHGFAVASFSKYCKGHHVVSTYSNETVFIEELKKILQKKEFDFVIPVGAPFVEWLTKHRKSLELYTRIPFPDSETIKRYENKKYTADIAKQLGIPVPNTIYPNSIEEVEQLSSSIQYPVVIKAIKEVGGNIVDYAANADELLVKYIATVEKHKLEKELPMLQEYLTGSGVGFFALYKDGVSLQNFQHKRIREYPISGGASCCAISIYDENLATYGKKILDHAAWDGVAMVEFKYNSSGIPCFLEVNPKFWGSYDLSEACGVNFAHKLICSQSGQPFIQNERYTESLIFSWPYNGDIQHCIVKGGLLKLFKDIILGRIITNTSWSDWKGSMAIRANWLLERFYVLYQLTKRAFK